MGVFQRCVKNSSGQAVVEAAFLIPVLFSIVLLMMQPCIILYDKMVMADAALQGCRVLATQPADTADDVESFVRRRLGSVPEQGFFHVHTPECTWGITCTGSEESDVVEVTITNEVQPLPIVGFAAFVFGAANERGNYEISVTKSLKTQPDWAGAAVDGETPREWVES